jgi:hypothetical protein
MRTFGVAALVSAALLGSAASASASTLGITSQPSSSSPGACNSSVAFGQAAQDPSTPYFVPAGGGMITQWEHVVAAGDTAGAPLEFVVLRPAAAEFTVVGTDTEALPTPLPAAGSLVTFTLATPISVQAGDTLGLYSSSTGAECYFDGSSVPGGDDITALGFTPTPPTTGETSTFSSPAPFASVIDVAATLGPITQDAAVTTTAGPSGASAGQAALLASTVTNNGPGTGPITFTDVVPAGMTVDAAVAGGGTCAASGQTVTCSVALGSGQSGPVDVVVTPSSPGSYTNHASVVVGTNATDPNTANNSASATLSVGLSLPAKCVVPRLKGVASGVAKTVLKDLGCRVRVSHAHSRSVHKGSVIKTKPGQGTYAYRRVITLVVSSGPKKKHHK